MSDQAFKKVVFYQFTCCDEKWFATAVEIDKTAPGTVINVSFEEVRKNGQEDCHMAGVATCRDGSWTLSEQVNIKDEFGDSGLHDLRNFFSDHGGDLLATIAAEHLR